MNRVPPPQLAAAGRHEAERDIRFVQIERKGLLGKGSFGETYLALLRGQEVAVKCVRVSGDVETTTFLRELEALTRISNPNVMAFYGKKLHKLLLLHCFLPNFVSLSHWGTTTMVKGQELTTHRQIPTGVVINPQSVSSERFHM